jgi:MoaA/NifB/PqqE/SkfB family radical SAM enzyme
MIPASIDFEMRGGDHPDEEMNAVEKSIAERAYASVNASSVWAELGYKRTYNLLHLFTFYMTRDPRIIKLLYRLQPYPEYIEMEVTQGICPLRCRQCELSYWDEKPIQVSFKDFKCAMDQFPNLKWAGNNALGDPFTNKDYWKMVKYVGDKGVNQEIYLTSQLLEPKDMEKFVTMNTHAYVKFSIDAATKKTYEYMRRGVDFDHVIENVKALDYYKKKHHKHFPEIHFHYLIMKNTIKEAEQFIDLVDGLGINCDGIMYSRLLHTFKEIEPYFMEVPEELCMRLQARGKKVGIPVSFNADARNKPPANECVAWTMPYIFPDGTVICCCCMNEQNRRDWQRKTRMGNIFETPFRDIWYGEKYTKLRNLLWQKKVKEAHPVCKICNIYDIDNLSDINER